jgi:cystathionine gamma-synthase
MTDRIETLAVHAGAEPDEISGGVSPSIQMSTTFRQDGIGKPRRGFEYGRSGNPTRQALEAAIAALEAGAHGLAYASGLAATQNLLYLLEPGERLILSDDAYGGTWRLASKVWSRYGVETEAVNLCDLDSLAAALANGTASPKVWI